MRKITNLCDVISRSSVYQPSLFICSTGGRSSKHFLWISFCDKALYSFPISGKKIIMSVSETEVENEK